MLVPTKETGGDKPRPYDVMASQSEESEKILRLGLWPRSG